jgi:hypothetical protein
MIVAKDFLKDSQMDLLFAGCVRVIVRAVSGELRKWTC